MRVGVHKKISKDLIIEINLVDNNFNERYLIRYKNNIPEEYRVDNFSY